ncbi:predicted protein [Chaetomium globosum CBS 148.51]|uniref:Uncharacterized protein n=1 Tax=Chaetomium globosum (strain ATCC 6205 / CBS 148.51 / DSM 1962 / NBRC 6347 / NRRL 1970) TaxID=306901 RepID=Q2GZ93_CHAGB|nr:uncharacterized protein CHGG_05153 [Chaetomium globosum CBS 148.51]EAQ88534.1 predicted protein [Chaetomium globosum CBS 148.51]
MPRLAGPLQPGRAPGWEARHPARAPPRPCTDTTLLTCPHANILHRSQLAPRTSHLAAEVWARIPGCGLSPILKDPRPIGPIPSPPVDRLGLHIAP